MKDMRPLSTWVEVPESRKREAYALAKQGKHHPSPEIAALAYGWANEVGPVGAGGFLWLACVALFDGLTGNPGASGSQLAEIRAARRIRRLGPRDPGSTV
jgi:hypothetical protein